MYYSGSTNGFYDLSIHGDSIPGDAVEITNDEHASLLQGQSEGKRIVADGEGHPVLADPTAPTQEQVIAQYEAALDNHLDSVARQYRYKDRFSFALRAGFEGPYQAEGIAFAQWMDGCNVQALGLLNDVIAGTEELPEIEDFIAMLPVFVAPSS